jgi:hypothetical protein
MAKVLVENRAETMSLMIKPKVKGRSAAESSGADKEFQV